MHENKTTISSPNLLSDRAILEPRDVLERLIRMNQRYKVELQHAIQRGDQKKFSIVQQINKIDYLQTWNG